MTYAIWKLSLIAGLSVIASAVLFLLDRKTKLGKMPYWRKQLLFGLIFGMLSVIGSEYGVVTNGVSMNVRDVAPLCAGLIFGAPAGILAGIIGAAERLLSVLWGGGTYTLVACCIATLLAGLFSAMIRRHLFDDERPPWGYGLFLGIVIEIVHLLLVFLTHVHDMKTCLPIIRRCTIPMSLLCGFAVMAALLIVTFLDGEKIFVRRDNARINLQFQRQLLICVLLAFLVTSGFTFLLQQEAANADAEYLLTLNLNDIKQEITDASDKNLRSVARAVAADLNSRFETTTEQLQLLRIKYKVSDINIVDPAGIIVNSTTSPDVGFDIHTGEQSAAFLSLLDGTQTEFVQKYGPITRDPSIYRKYAGVTLKNGGFVQVGYDAQSFQADIANQVVGVTNNRHVGETGFAVVADSAGMIVSDPNGSTGRELSFLFDEASVPDLAPRTVHRLDTIYCHDAYAMYDTCEGYYIVAILPGTEVDFARDLALYTTIFIEALIFTALFVLVYFLIKKLFDRPLQEVNRSLDKITDGDLEESVNVRGSLEFSALSDDINSTVDTLKRYIAEEAARIDKELEFAKAIQHSALPDIFPPYPDRDEFAVYADMFTAKEVGGDFYDFYLLGEDRLAFLIADVSGKGIPAAMFMMTAKTMLKNHIESGVSIADAFRHANEELCASNEAGMFVTVWMGILDLKTGIVEYVNAGHNPPVLRRGDGTYEYFRTRAGFVLAGMEGFPYKSGEMQLMPGDRIFLYTDGVTEATNANDELFGEDRLLRILNEKGHGDVAEVCGEVKAAVDAFVGDTPQFDDITMLSLFYQKNME